MKYLLIALIFLLSGCGDTTTVIEKNTIKRLLEKDRNMVYENYLPTEALIGVPELRTFNIYNFGTEYTIASRTTYADRFIEYGYIEYNPANPNTELSNYKVIGDNGNGDSTPTPRYSKGNTYNTGDIVTISESPQSISEVGILFKFAGLNPLTISTDDDFAKNHPLRVEEDNRVNSNIWVSYGTTNDSAYRIEGKKKFDLTNIEPDYRAETYDASLDDYGLHNAITIIKVEFNLYHNDMALIYEIENCDKAVVVTQNDSFEVNLSNKNKLAILNTTQGGSTHFDIYLYGKGDLSISGDTLASSAEEFIKTSPRIGKILKIVSPTHIGSQLIGHTQSRVSEFKTVISDGVEKSMVTKSYDTFNGHVLVDEADLQKVEYALAKATQGDYVFHTGTGKELYDQRVYLGKIKYSSPIEDKSGKFKININGQSLSYGVENPLITPDSTDGYAQ